MDTASCECPQLHWMWGLRVAANDTGPCGSGCQAGCLTHVAASVCYFCRVTEIVQYPSGGGSACPNETSLYSLFPCVLNSVCTSCSDGSRSVNESDVDCGGASTCARCAAGFGCEAVTDCAPDLVCGINNTCIGVSPRPGSCDANDQWLAAKVLLSPASWTLCVCASDSSALETPYYVTGVVALAGIVRSQFNSIAQGGFTTAVASHLNNTRGVPTLLSQVIVLQVGDVASVAAGRRLAVSAINVTFAVTSSSQDAADVIHDQLVLPYVVWRGWLSC